MRETMMQIRGVFLEWQVNAISDNTAVKRIETLIQQTREREWNASHPGEPQLHGGDVFGHDDPVCRGED